MRLSISAGSAVLVALLAATTAGQQVLLPEQNTARARELVQQAIEALGGAAYRNVRDIYREGRLAQFSSAGELAGYVKFFDYVKLPDKNRTEFYDQRNIITVMTSEEGWELDRGGIQPAGPEAVERYRRNLRKDVLEYVLRYRLNEEGLALRYQGSDVVDLKQVDWVELVDRERTSLRIALDRNTRLPIRAVIVSRDPLTRQRIEEVEYYANYHPVDGVMTPMQIQKQRNGINYYQVFFTAYRYNTGLDDTLFTRASLEERWAKLNKKKK